MEALTFQTHAVDPSPQGPTVSLPDLCRDKSILGFKGLLAPKREPLFDVLKTALIFIISLRAMWWVCHAIDFQERKHKCCFYA